VRVVSLSDLFKVRLQVLLGLLVLPLVDLPKKHVDQFVFQWVLPQYSVQIDKFVVDGVLIPTQIRVIQVSDWDFAADAPEDGVEVCEIYSICVEEEVKSPRPSDSSVAVGVRVEGRERGRV